MVTSPEELEQPQPPQGHVRIVYLGPLAPHWEVQGVFGDRGVIDEFRQRALARLQLLPPTIRSSGGTASGWPATRSVRRSSSTGTSAPKTNRPTAPGDGG